MDRTNTTGRVRRVGAVSVCIALVAALSGCLQDPSGDAVEPASRPDSATFLDFLPLVEGDYVYRESTGRVSMVEFGPIRDALYRVSVGRPSAPATLRWQAHVRTYAYMDSAGVRSPVPVSDSADSGSTSGFGDKWLSTATYAGGPFAYGRDTVLTLHGQTRRVVRVFHGNPEEEALLADGLGALVYRYRWVYRWGLTETSVVRLDSVGSLALDPLWCDTLLARLR